MSFFSSKKSTPETDTTTSDTPTSTLATEIQEEHPLTEIVRFAILALIIVVPIRMFIAQPFIVSGASMEDTFHGGEYLIVDQLSYYFEDPARGDVVIFRYPRDPSKFFIKRIIGMPGDTLTIEGDSITISNEEHPDGVVIDEPYIAAMDPTTTIKEERLRDNEYFVMGDNRNYSSDSRMWGVLTRDKIVGRAFLRLFPVQEIGVFPGKYTAEEIMIETISSPN